MRGMGGECGEARGRVSCQDSPDFGCQNALKVPPKTFKILPRVTPELLFFWGKGVKKGNSGGNF